MTNEADSVVLTSAQLDPARAIALVMDPQAGGIDVFLGTTRAETDTSPRGRELAALEYAAYEEMALAEMRKLVEQARARWEIRRCVVHHRLGSCAVGEISVVIAVSCAHRAEAFEACRFLIDQLKTTVPIWKKDVYRDRGGRWHHDPR